MIVTMQQTSIMGHIFHPTPVVLRWSPCGHNELAVFLIEDHEFSFSSHVCGVHGLQGNIPVDIDTQLATASSLGNSCTMSNVSLRTLVSSCDNDQLVHECFVDQSLFCEFSRFCVVSSLDRV